MPPQRGKKYRPRAAKPSGLLQDMRWVYANPKATRDTAGKELCGVIYDKDKQDFATRLERMEKEYANRGSGADAPEPETGGNGLPPPEPVELLIDRLITEATKEVT